jgi:hypothetical protein
MAKTKKKSTRSRSKETKNSWASSGYILKDVLALAGTFGNLKKDLGADKILEFAAATREFASSMADIPSLDKYADMAVESLEEVSDYVRETDFEQIALDASNFSRRHPTVVIAGGIVAGLVATHILRSNGGILKPRRSAKATKRSGATKKTRNAAVSRSSKNVNGHAHLNS